MLIATCPRNAFHASGRAGFLPLRQDGSTSAGNETYVYLGVKDYGTVEADSKPDFVHRFYTNGKEVQYTIASSDNKYAVQNKLQEGYVYDLSTQGSVVTDAKLAAAKAEGKIESATASSVTVGGKTYDIANVYEITNNTAGKATVTAKTTADLTGRCDRQGLRRHRVPYVRGRGLYRARQRHAR